MSDPRPGRRIFLAAPVAALALASLLLLSPPDPAARSVEVAPRKVPQPPAHETALSASTELFAGSRASFRCGVHQVRSSTRTTPLSAAVTVRLHTASKALLLYEGKTGADGQVDVRFTVPDLPAGLYRLEVHTKSARGEEKLQRDVRIHAAPRILLTTDKPLYQPGQTIHLRALALRAFDLAPWAAASLTLEVEDGKGNKVFKKTLKTSDYGLAAVDFILADEVNLGDFRIRAVVGEQRTEKTVSVQRYVLPKFKAALKTDRSFYLPKETIKAELQVDYFFGKPVAGALVEVKASTFDVAFKEFATWKGKSNASGHAKFEVKLPDYFVGLPLAKGDAVVRLEVKVTDTAEHSETVGRMVPVSDRPIRVSVIPEAGRLVPGVENTLFVAALYPDGSPASCDVDVWVGQAGKGKPLATLKTNEAGLTELKLTPRAEQFRAGAWGQQTVEMLGGVQQRWLPSNLFDLTAEARDARGNRARSVVGLTSDPLGENVLLRLDRALYKGGDSVRVDVRTTAGLPTVYLDVIKAGQTVLTRWLEVQKGRARTTFDLPATLFGTLEVHAYQVLGSGEIIRDSRVLHVSPADELKVQVTADRDTYRPGHNGTIRFEVTDTAGKPTPAALGVLVVDEAVYALQEMQPGLEKVYFTLQQELLRPRAQADFKPREGLDSLILERALDRQGQQVARVLMTAARPRPSTRWEVDPAQVRRQKVRTLARVVGAAAFQHGAQGQPVVRKDPRSGAWTFVPTLLEDLVKANRLTKPQLDGPLGAPVTLAALGRMVRGFTAERLERALARYRSGSRTLWSVEYRQLASFWWDDSEKLDPGQANLRWRGEAMIDPPLPPAPRPMFLPRGRPGRGGGGGGGGLPRAAGRPPMKKAASRPRSAPASGKLAGGGGTEPAGEPLRLREYFPETLLWQPALLTDEQGRASLEVALADSITTWRLSATASSRQGLLGGTSAPLRVFQDFFVDLDLPVALTQNDEVAFPVAVYNYLKEEQTVSLVLNKEPWFELLDGSERRTLRVKAGEVTAVRFRIKARRVGTFALQVEARGSKLSDAIKRLIEVRPDGRPVEQVFGGRLEGTVSHKVHLPASAVEGASRLTVKLYPGVVSQLVDGLEGMLRLPTGCFEQTSSSAYPNILIVDYLKKSRTASPALLLKAEALLSAGYQRLLTFERPGGGFDWWGSGEPLVWLSAYGLQEFHDMARVYPVDPAVIQRTQAWLFRQQEADGTWSKIGATHGESITRMGDAKLLLTSYVAWSLLDSMPRPAGWQKGEEYARLKKAIAYIREQAPKAGNAYILALSANALASWDAKDDSTFEVLKKVLKALDERKERLAQWKALAFRPAGQSLSYGRGDSLTVETTALAVLAMLKNGEFTSSVNGALTYLVKSRGGHGHWGSTQATILALKALLAGLGGVEHKGVTPFTVRVNGKAVASGKITRDNADVLQHFDLKEHLQPGDNEVAIAVKGETSLMYQVVGRHFEPHGKEVVPARPALEIGLEFDRTKLTTRDLLRATATLTYRGKSPTFNVIVDLPIPPGFTADGGDFADMVKAKKVQKFSLTARQVILYLGAVKPGDRYDFSYALKPKYPVKAKAPSAVAYEYYTPTSRAEAKPVLLVVEEKK